MSLQFRVAHLQRELHALHDVARPFLARHSQDKLRDLADDLERIRLEGRAARWEIAEDDPLETDISPGRYGLVGGGPDVWASIDSAWDVEIVDGELVQLRGVASTRIQLYNEDGKVGLWRMEIGGDPAPGCQFHVQIEGQDTAAGEDRVPVFLRGIDIPRLPCFVATPASAVEFVLSELFQEDWRRRQADHASTPHWVGVQRNRWRGFLDWQRAIVEASTFSPWVEIKVQTAPDDSFC